jgi:hypothetical protein
LVAAFDRFRGIAAIMLPGLRTLAATVLLAFAVITFAFGAAALLRVAHEDFAVLPTWRPAMDPLTETVAAKAPDQPTLAVLRVEPDPETTQQIVPEAKPSPPVEIVAPAPQPPAAVVAALPPAPAAPKIELADRPYNVPLAGPRLVPEIATNDAAPAAFASLAPLTSDTNPIDVAPLPRPRPQLVQPAVRKRIVRRPPARRVASRPAAQPRQALSPLDQLFNNRN